MIVLSSGIAEHNGGGGYLVNNVRPELL
jgi:hypothetical protein